VHIVISSDNRTSNALIGPDRQMDQRPYPLPQSALLLCVRVPKSGSASLMHGLAEAFAARSVFYLPNTLDPDSRVSRLQKLRFLRARLRNLHRNYHTVRMQSVWARINREAALGDLLMGGHADFRTVRANIAQPLKIITLLREPLARARSEYDYMRRGQLRKPPLRRLDSSVLHKVAGRYDFNSYLDYLFERRHIYGNIACQYLGWDGSEGIPNFFAHNVFHCGLLERSEAFADGLAAKLGRSFALPHENREPGLRPEITSAQRKKLEQIYQRDIELYEWVRGN
jgi:hypothetical protein